MIHVTAGRLNKQIAGDIGITESTVKVHRANLMRKLGARSLPELSRMADRLNLATEQPLRSSSHMIEQRDILRSHQKSRVGS